ncbi:MAG TPA: ABC transporter permease [Chryseolinea sp.]|nr:ABC transporter permease [Chryseolinea sp.]
MNYKDLPQPPRWAACFLQWICPPPLYEGIVGDLEEQFAHDIEAYGIRKAKWNFTRHVLMFCRPSIILRNKIQFDIMETIMFGNYMRIAARHFQKHKAFWSIQVLGLALGITACILILQFVSLELSYDKSHKNGERIFRITSDRFQQGKLVHHGTTTYPAVGPALSKEYPEIEQQTRLMHGFADMTVRIGEDVFTGGKYLFADEHFLSVFTFNLLAGEYQSALKEPNTVVLTAHQAKKYFDLSHNDFSKAIGRTFTLGLNKQPYVVTAVCEDIPANSHLQFDALVSYATLVKMIPMADDSWTWSDMRHYVVLREGLSAEQLQPKLDEFAKRHLAPTFAAGNSDKFYLQPLWDIHLYSDYEYDFAKTANGKAVWGMLAAALFVLALSWVNYMNLTLGRGIDRLKEIGIRKVMGALKTQVISQFICESFLWVVCSLVIALIAVIALQPAFNQLVGEDLSLVKTLNAIDGSVTLFIIAILFTGLIGAGLYPAFVFSTFQPIGIVKDTSRGSTKSILRKGLIVFQFCATTCLMIGTMVIGRQLSFMDSADLGIDITRTLVIAPPSLTPWDTVFVTKFESLKQELSRFDKVKSVTTSVRLPGQRLPRISNVRLKGQPDDTRYSASVMGIGQNFFEAYDVRLLAGRYFVPEDYNMDWSKVDAIIINECTAKQLGFASVEDAINKEIFAETRFRKIKGVVSDFHQESLKNPKEPMLFNPIFGNSHYLSIKLSKGSEDDVIPFVSENFKKFFPGNIFDYSFLDDSFKANYNDDRRFSNVTIIFTALAIVISALGLIGLAAHAAKLRTREVGIRKVMGASIMSILSTLSADFMKPVLAAALISIPISYMLLENWLSQYAYHIPFDWQLIFIPVLLTIATAWLTLTFQLSKTARVNPVDTLKHE